MRNEPSAPPQLAELVEQLQAKADRHRERLRGPAARFEVRLTGVGGGVFSVQVEAGRAVLGLGALASPQLVIEASRADFEALLHGELSPLQAYLRGRIRLSGALSLAFRLQEILQ